MYSDFGIFDISDPHYQPFGRICLLDKATRISYSCPAKLFPLRERGAEWRSDVAIVRLRIPGVVT